MIIVRRPDWRTRLHAYLAECLTRELTWGEHDCALFAAGAVYEMTGVDIGAEWRGKYSTEAGAAKAMRKAGFVRAGDIAAEIFETTQAPAEGDLAEVDLALGVMGQGAIHCVTNGRGLFWHPGPAVRYFRVPFAEGI